MTSERLDYLARRVATDEFFVAALLAGRADADLLTALGCTPGQLTRLKLCRAPRAGEDRAGWVARVAGACGLDAARLASLIAGGNRPATPTERRAARAQVVARIVAEGLTPAEARATNAGDGWALVAPDGTAATWRWARNEFAVVARLVEEAAGRPWRDGSDG